MPEHGTTDLLGGSLLAEQPQVRPNLHQTDPHGEVPPDGDVPTGNDLPVAVAGSSADAPASAQNPDVTAPLVGADAAQAQRDVPTSSDSAQLLRTDSVQPPRTDSGTPQRVGLGAPLVALPVVAQRLSADGDPGHPEPPVAVAPPADLPEPGWAPERIGSLLGSDEVGAHRIGSDDVSAHVLAPAPAKPVPESIDGASPGLRLTAATPRSEMPAAAQRIGAEQPAPPAAHVVTVPLLGGVVQHSSNQHSAPRTDINRDGWSAPIQPGRPSEPAALPVSRIVAEAPGADASLAVPRAAGSSAAALRPAFSSGPDPGTAALAAGIASPDADGSYVFAAPVDTPVDTPSAQHVQRAEDTASAVAAPAEMLAAPVAPSGTNAAGGPASPGAAPSTDIDELARRLFDPLTAHLKAELRLDRERAGLVTDLHR